MSSFSTKVKKELCQIEYETTCCKFAQCYAMALFGRSFNQNEISFMTEHEVVAKEYSQLVKEVCGVKVDLHYRKSGKIIVSISEKKDRQTVLETFGQSSKDITLRINRANLTDECCNNAFIKGAFLVCGSVTDPDKDYHLEFSIQHLNLSKDFETLLREVNLTPKRALRKGQRILYYKESERIEDMLTFIGAPNASLQVMGVKMYKNIRNNVNRKTNFETANISRTVDAAMQQIEAIKYLKKSGKLKELSDELQELAILRLENPDMSLRELGEQLSTPISRSGVNHRFNRLLKITKDEKRSK